MLAITYLKISCSYPDNLSPGLSLGLKTHNLCDKKIKICMNLSLVL